MAQKEHRELKKARQRQREDTEEAGGKLSAHRQALTGNEKTSAQKKLAADRESRSRSTQRYRMPRTEPNEDEEHSPLAARALGSSKSPDRS